MARVMRKATLNDIDFLVSVRMEVLDAVFTTEMPSDSSEIKALNRAYYERALADESHIACLVFEEGEFAGCGGLCLQREMPSPDNRSGRCAYLMNVYTRPAFREHGVASAVVHWLVEQAHTHGVEKITLETTADARLVYEKAGFKQAEGFLILTCPGF